MSFEIIQFSPSVKEGIFVDKNDERLVSTEGMRDLMSIHDIEPRPVPVGVRDITPTYGDKTLQRYMMSRQEPDGPVTIDILPRRPDIEQNLFRYAAQGIYLQEQVSVKKVVIPTDVHHFTLGVPGKYNQIRIDEIIFTV